MLSTLLSCFACGDRNSAVISPQTPDKTKIQPAFLLQSDIKTDDNKSRISQTYTYLTAQTAPTKDEDDDEMIRRKIEILKKKELPQRKAMETQFVKQNLMRSHIIYLIDKKWSEEYTKFLKTQNMTSMPTIDNSKLLDGEGELKINLREKQDYFIVTEKIWKFIHGLYGGGPAIAKDSTFPVIALNIKKITLSPIGIQNPLNFCFMNSVMQMLLSIEQFNGYILKKGFNENSLDGKKKIYHNALYKFIKQYMEAQNNPNPSDPVILQIKQFASYFQNKFDPQEQHDAHQFMVLFMQLLQSEMKSESSLVKSGTNLESLYAQYFKEYRSIVDKTFAGQQQTVVTCSFCQFKSMTYLPFLEIVLSIKGMDQIEKCLKNYFQTEKLQDLYECEKCKKKTKAVKSTCITKAPNYLIIVLGKFQSSTLKKIQDRIQYDFELDLANYCSGHCGQTLYSLNSMVIHKGSKSNKGHYYTLARRGNKNEWYYFNDNCVKKIQKKEVLGRDPYILLYERSKTS